MKNIDIAFAKRIVDGINHHITGFSPVTYESLKKLSKPNHVIMLNSSFSYSDSLDSYYKLLDWAKRKFGIDSEQLYNLVSSVIEQFRTCVYNAFMVEYSKALKEYEGLLYIPVETIEDVLIVLKSLYKSKDNYGTNGIVYDRFLDSITKAIGKVNVSTFGDEIILSFGHSTESLSNIAKETLEAIGSKYDQIATFNLVNKDLGISISYGNISNVTDIKWPKDNLVYSNIIPQDRTKPIWTGLIIFKDGSVLMRLGKLIDGERKEVWSRLTPVDNKSYEW